MLEQLESSERKKVVDSVMVLLGEEPTRTGKGNSDEGEEDDCKNNKLGRKALHWMKQNGIEQSMLDEVFHCDGDVVEVIADAVPGNGKKNRSKNCYLLAGAQAFLATDSPTFSDESAIELCKQFGCHDASNHASTRNEVSNTLSGNKNSGFTLPAPRLKDAATLIKQMTTES